MATGWVAMAILVALAATSNNPSVRRLGRTWHRLHRLVYLAAGLVTVHWVGSAFDPTAGYVHLAVLAAVEASRFRFRASRDPVRGTSPPG